MRIYRHYSFNQMRRLYMPETKQTETTMTTVTETKQEERKPSLLLDILTIIGFAILFIIIIWGLVHLVSLVSSSLSSNFSKPAPAIEVSAPAATSGQPVTVSWTYSPSVKGSYAFLYECQSGLSFATQVATSTKAQIPCGTAYTVAGANNSLTLTPTLSATSTATDTVSVVFIPSQSGSQVQGNATMSISPAAKPAPAKTTTVSSVPKTYAYAGTNYSGPAQLSVRVISGNINAYGDGTVTFDIANIGGATSGSYYFEAQLPTAEAYPYQSPLQSPLTPGSHVTSTLNFTDARSGGGEFSVTIEGNGANSASDYASMEIPGPYNYNNYGNNYNYSEPDTVYPSYSY